jgi:hypothetical protein
MGCRTLLILPGSSYVTRLWCVMEIYTFVYMGGQNKNMRVRPLTEDEDLITKLKAFDAGDAQCFLRRDRDKLLAVVEASFGTLRPFNRIVRDLFAEKLEEVAAQRRVRKKLQLKMKLTLGLHTLSGARVGPRNDVLDVARCDGTSTSVPRPMALPNRTTTAWTDFTSPDPPP